MRSARSWRARISSIARNPETGPAATRTLSDLELASRLSFFLWSSLPDEELLKLATESRLSNPDVLAAQVSRMLADPRAKSLSDDFAFQWLHLAKLDEITPDRGQFPHASGLLDPRALFKEELRLFIDSVLRSDRSVLELLTADYTFLNERLAMHYGIETVKGSHFRRVTLDDKARHGLLGKGAILMLTAYPNRTSPVLRGAWILDRLLGTPPSDPPLDVPSLPENRRGQPATNTAGEARAAPREADVLRLSRRDGSTRVGAGEFQRGGSVPCQRPRHADANRCCRSAAGWHGDHRT